MTRVSAVRGGSLDFPTSIPHLPSTLTCWEGPLLRGLFGCYRISLADTGLLLKFMNKSMALKRVLGRWIVLCLAIWHNQTWALCPNLCSGNGDCDEYNRCICYEGFEGKSCVCPKHSRCPSKLLGWMPSVPFISFPDTSPPSRFAVYPSSILLFLSRKRSIRCRLLPEVVPKRPSMV